MTTSLLFHSSLPIRLSTPRVILGTVSLSHAALMASVCVCVCKCVYFCVDPRSCVRSRDLFWQVQLPRNVLAAAAEVLGAI